MSFEKGSRFESSGVEGEVSSLLRVAREHLSNARRILENHEYAQARQAPTRPGRGFAMKPKDIVRADVLEALNTLRVAADIQSGRVEELFPDELKLIRDLLDEVKGET